MSSFLENTDKFIKASAKIAQIPGGALSAPHSRAQGGDILARLEKPNKVLEFEILVKMDDGTEKKFPGWRVQHNNALGPYKGGIRFHPESNLDEVRALASLMTWKTALAGLPYGGAKGAVKVDPRALSKRELEELSRGYVRAIWREIGPEKDVPAPDVGTNSQIMDWMVDEYGKLSGGVKLAAFTGKSIKNGGSQGRDVATGFGGYVILREFLKTINYGNGLTVAIQGFGNVGAGIAKILFDRGFKIVALSDSKGALYEETGIDINKILDVKEKTGIIERRKCYALAKEKIAAYISCKELTNEELLTLEVGVLIPAALENQITELNAQAVKAKTILEMANGPVTPEGEEILARRGIEVIPDILANGGGVVGSYFEWLQSFTPLENLKRYELQLKPHLGRTAWDEVVIEINSLMGQEQKYWSEKEVLDKIDAKLTETFESVLETKNKYNISWRLASYVLALTRVAEKIK